MAPKTKRRIAPVAEDVDDEDYTVDGDDDGDEGEDEGEDEDVEGDEGEEDEAANEAPVKKKKPVAGALAKSKPWEKGFKPRLANSAASVSRERRKVPGTKRGPYRKRPTSRFESDGPETKRRPRGKRGRRRTDDDDDEEEGEDEEKASNVRPNANFAGEPEDELPSQSSEDIEKIRAMMDKHFDPKGIAAEDPTKPDPEPEPEAPVPTSEPERDSEDQDTNEPEAKAKPKAKSVKRKAVEAKSAVSTVNALKSAAKSVPVVPQSIAATPTEYTMSPVRCRAFRLPFASGRTKFAKYVTC